MPNSMSYLSIQYTKVMGVQSFIGKVDVPDLVTYLNWTPIFEWYMGLVWLQERRPRRHRVFERVWTMCPKYANYSKPNSQHIWGGGTYITHWTSMRIYTLIMKKKCSYELRKSRLHKSGYGLDDLDLLTISYWSWCVSASQEKWAT